MKKRQPSSPAPGAVSLAVPADRLAQIEVSLRPKGVDLSASEFLTRCWTFPEIARVHVQKYAARTWSHVEHLDSMTPGLQSTEIETHLATKHGAWRYRLLPIVDDPDIVLPHHIVSIDGWVENEAKAMAALSGSTRLTNGAAPAASVIHDTATALKERIELTTLTRAAQDMDAKASESKVAADFAPMNAMATMMQTMMQGFATMMTSMAATQQQARPQNDAALEFLREEVTYLRRRLEEGGQQKNPDLLMKTLETVDQLVQRTLGNSLAEIAKGGLSTAAAPESGIATVLREIIQGLQPALPGLMAMLAQRSGAPMVPTRFSMPRPASPNAATVPPGAPALASLPAAPAVPATEESPMAMTPEFQAQIKELVDLLLDALASENWQTVEAIVENPPVNAMIRLNPHVSPRIYVVQLKMYDPRFGDALVIERIGKYFAWCRAQDAAADVKPDPGPEAAA